MLDSRIARFLFAAVLAVSITAPTRIYAQKPYVLHHSLFDPTQSGISNETFGVAVAISGTRAVVGAPSSGSTRTTGLGSVYVYDLASATSILPALTLTNSDSKVSDGFSKVFDGFGKSVALSGARLVIGAPFDSTGATNAGSAYVYDLASTAPTVPLLMLTNPTPKVKDWFGWSVAISDTRVVVGAYYDDTGALYAGSAYVYDLTSTTPAVPVVTLTNPTPARSDIFGISVAISGSWVVVGAYLDDTSSNDAGSAYVYDLTNPTPAVPTLTLTNPSPLMSYLFGYSVAISGTRVVVGAYGNSIETTLGGSYTLAGSAYVYDLAGATPAVPVVTLNNPSPAHFESFGWSVAISGTRVVVGAENDNIETERTGNAYVYELAGALPTVPVATLTNPSPAFDDRMGFSVAIDGTTVIASAPLDDTLATDSGAAYVFGLLPALSIVPVAPASATISWIPSTSSGFVLQYADSLASDNWLNAPSGALNPVTISTTHGTRFYRLFQP